MKALLSCIIVSFVLSCSEKGSHQTNETSPNDAFKIDLPTNDRTSHGPDDDFIDIDSQVYRKEFLIDITLVINTHDYRVSIQVDFDSANKVTVPKKYVEVWGLNRFDVFESYSTVKVKLNRNIVVDTTIRKESFEESLDMPLKNYDNLFSPDVELYFATSPYVYTLNQPTNAVDHDGNLVIFINGDHFGDGGSVILEKCSAS